MGAINKFGDFFKSVYFELKKVNWPTRREAIHLTLVVIISVLVATLIITGLDLGLSKILEFVISKN